MSLDRNGYRLAGIGFDVISLFSHGLLTRWDGWIGRLVHWRARFLKVNGMYTE